MFEEIAYQTARRKCAARLQIYRNDVALTRHVHLGGHYTFLGSGPSIDLDAIIQGLALE